MLSKIVLICPVSSSLVAAEEDKGTVSITHKQKKLPGLRVIKEKNAWKGDER